MPPRLIHSAEVRQGVGRSIGDLDRSLVRGDLVDDVSIRSRQSGERSEAAAAYEELQRMWRKADPPVRKAVEASLARVKGAPGGPSVP